MIRVEITRGSNAEKIFNDWLAQTPQRVRDEIEVDRSHGCSIVFDGYGSALLLKAWAATPVNCARQGCSIKDGKLLERLIASAINQIPAANTHHQPWIERREIGSWVIAEDETDEECGQIVAPAHRNERCYRVRFAEGKERVIPAILLEPASPLEILGAQDDDPEDHNPNLDF